MAGEWRASTWGEEISLEYGKALRGHDETRGRYRVFGANGPIGWTSEPLAQGPEVILGRKGAYRGVQYSSEPFFVIDTAYYVVPKSDLDMRWLYYAIKHYKLGEVDDGSPIPSTTRAAVYMLDLDVPPADEQRAIARILGALDDKIEMNRRMNETLEAIARALFHSRKDHKRDAWMEAQGFTVFRSPNEQLLDDPASVMTAIAERVEAPPPSPSGRRAGDEGSVEALDRLFSARLVDSELGEIPEGWEVKTIGDLAEVVGGSTPRTTEPIHRH